MDELIGTQKCLPTDLADIAKFVLVGREKLVAVRAEIRAINKLGLAEEVRQQKLEEAQMLSEALLDAEVRIGALTFVIPKAKGGEHYHKGTTDTAVASAVTKPKAETIKELGLTQKQVERFEILARHPEIVEQAKVEARAADDIVSRSFVLEKIKGAELAKRRESIKITEPRPITGRFSIIYADPPYRHDNSIKNRAVENHYPTMSLEEIKEIKVPRADNAVLLLWTPASMLTDALEIMEAWGFSYKTCAVWDKEKIGMGFWFRGQHELLLLGVCGDVSPPNAEFRVSSVYREIRGAHSKKPNFYYTMVESMFPNETYLELFARKQHNEKWMVWGNQVD